MSLKRVLAKNWLSRSFSVRNADFVACSQNGSVSGNGIVQFIPNKDIDEATKIARKVRDTIQDKNILLLYCSDLSLIYVLSFILLFARTMEVIEGHEEHLYFM